MLNLSDLLFNHHKQLQDMQRRSQSIESLQLATMASVERMICPMLDEETESKLTDQEMAQFKVGGTNND
jgi:hypothetical protein